MLRINRFSSLVAWSPAVAVHTDMHEPSPIKMLDYQSVITDSVVGEVTSIRYLVSRAISQCCAVTYVEKQSESHCMVVSIKPSAVDPCLASVLELQLDEMDEWLVASQVSRPGPDGTQHAKLPTNDVGHSNLLVPPSLTFHRLLLMMRVKATRCRF